MEHPDFAATVFAVKSRFSSIPPSRVRVRFRRVEGGSRSPPWEDPPPALGAAGAPRDRGPGRAPRLPSAGGWGERRHSQASAGQGFRQGQRVPSDLLTGKCPAA